MKFTKQDVASLTLPEGKADAIYFDDAMPGFGIRLRTGGKRVWIVQYRADGRQRRQTLGDVRKVDLDAARGAAKKLFAQVTLGADPQADRVEAKVRAALTLGPVADRYLKAKEDAIRPSTYTAAKRYFEVHWKPLRGRPIAKIKRQDVGARLLEISGIHGRRSAKAAKANLSALFTWAMREGLCEVNPVLATNNPAAGLQSRERVLTDAEVRIVWNASADDDFGRIVKLLILTACRREEIGGLRRPEVNFDTGVMTIPGERTKNHREHALTLPAVAIDILQSVPARQGRDFFFGARGGSFSAWSYATLHLHSRIAEAEGKALPRWTLHDLRRTVRTGMGKLGVAPHIAELVLNHRKGGVEGIYDRHKYEREITAALALWADHVRSITEGGERKVIAFPT
jgi:integrase